jgi:hypothetical protein
METINLAVCPAEVSTLDANAMTLWPVLLKKVGVTVSRGEHIEDRRAWILRNFGVDDLAGRLDVQQQREKCGPQDDVARARIWRHVAEACLPGDSIGDITPQNMYLLNAFIVPKARRFASPLDALRRTPSSELPLCANDRCPHGPAKVPISRAKFCSRSCRNVVSRRDGYVKPVRTAKMTLQEAA